MRVEREGEKGAPGIERERETIENTQGVVWQW